MIKKIFLITIILFVIYTVFLTYFFPEIGVSQNPGQANEVKAEKYLYGDFTAKQGVILGSSLSNKLRMEYLEEYYNLSFTGKSIFDGLSIVLKKVPLPEKLIIETNILLREEDKAFTNSIVRPVPFFLKKHLISLRKDKQPLGIFGAKVNSVIISPTFLKFKLLLNRDKEEMEDSLITNNELFEKLLDFQVENYSQKPDSIFLRSQINKLKYYVSKFRNNGVEIIFFEMPVNRAMDDLSKSKIIHEYFISAFPPEQNYVIYPPDNMSFNTTDGLHLTKDEAIVYSKYLESELKESARRITNF